MKNQVQLTPHALETWCATLSVYDPRIVNAAVLEIGLSDDPFPDLGKLTIRCEVLRRRFAGTTPEGGVKKLSSTAVRRIAQTMRLELPRDY